MYSAYIQRNSWMEITAQLHKAVTIHTMTSFPVPQYGIHRHLENKTWYVGNKIHFIVTAAVLSTTHISYSGFSRFDSCLMSRVALLRSCIQTVCVNVATTLYKQVMAVSNHIIRNSVSITLDNTAALPSSRMNMCRTYRYKPELTDWSIIRISLANSK
jgi:putative effector of murein hydrolase